MALGKWQMREFTSWKGLTKLNHLSAIYGDKPQLATATMIRLMEHNYGKSLEHYLSRFPTKYFEEDSEFNDNPTSSEEIIGDGNAIIYNPSEWPTFQGGDINTFSTWVKTNSKYPDLASQLGIEE